MNLFTRRQFGTLMLAGAALMAGAPAEAADKVRYIIAQRPLLAALPLVAMATGTFEKHGLDVEHIEVNAASGAVSAMLAGEADVAHVGGAALANAIAEGADLQMVGAGTQAAQIVVLAPAAYEKLGLGDTVPAVDRLRALKGLTLATGGPGSGSEAITFKLLAHAGLDPVKDVTLVPMRDTSAFQAALRGGLVDGAVHGAGSGLEGNLKDKTGILYFSMVQDPVPSANSLAAASGATRAWIEENPDRARRFHAALAEARRLVDEKPDEVRQALKDRFYEAQDQETFDIGYAIASKAWSEDARIPQELFDRTLEAVALAGRDTSRLVFEQAVFDAAR